MDAREPSRVRDQGTVVNRCATGQERVEACRQIVAECQYRKVDGVMVDLFSASAVVKVDEALSESNRVKFRALTIGRMASVAFKLMERAS